MICQYQPAGPIPPPWPANSAPPRRDPRPVRRVAAAFALLGLTLASCARTVIDPATLTAANMAAPPAYAELLATYVTAEGVRYPDWHAHAIDRQRLGSVVAFYRQTLPPEDDAASLAWHLNAYNAWTLHNILEKYPTRGPLHRDPLFFHGNRIAIAGRRTSLDALEQKVIRPVFDEPRIHFALNCASQSCPPLLDRPFTAEQLDRDLDRLATAFVNDRRHGVDVREGKVRLSKIFEWYADDFGGRDRLVEYVNRYRDEPVPAGLTIEFMDYSWALNEATAP